MTVSKPGDCNRRAFLRTFCAMTDTAVVNFAPAKHSVELRDIPIPNI
jgi:hypothetical protein